MLLPPLLIEDQLETTEGDACCEDIGECDAFADKEGMNEEVFIENFDSLERFGFSVFDILFVVGVVPKKRTEPASESWKNFRIGEGHPSDNGCVILLGLAQEASFLVLRGDFDRLVCDLSHQSHNYATGMKIGQSVNCSQQ